MGSALYLGASAIDHSCLPNTIWTFNEREIILVAINQVESFSDLRYSYIGNKFHEKTKKRKEYLLEHYHFTCICCKCEDSMSDKLKSSMICKKCKVGCVPIPSPSDSGGELPNQIGNSSSDFENTGVCVDCNEKSDADSIRKFEIWKKKFMDETEMDVVVNNPQICQHVLDQAVEVFHPYDEDFVTFLDSVWQKFYNAQKYSRTYTILKLIMSNYEHNMPKYYFEIGRKYYEFADVCYKLNLFQESRLNLEKAEEILTANKYLSQLFDECKALRTALAQVTLSTTVAQGSVHIYIFFLVKSI